MNKLQAYFRVISVRHSRQANSVFGDPTFRAGGPKFRAGGPKFRAGGPKFCTGSLICTSSKFILVHLGDDVRDASCRYNYISIFLLKNRDRP